MTTISVNNTEEDISPGISTDATSDAKNHYDGREGENTQLSVTNEEESIKESSSSDYVFVVGKEGESATAVLIKQDDTVSPSAIDTTAIDDNDKPQQTTTISDDIDDQSNMKDAKTNAEKLEEESLASPVAVITQGSSDDSNVKTGEEGANEAATKNVSSNNNSQNTIRSNNRRKGKKKKGKKR